MIKHRRLFFSNSKRKVIEVEYDSFHYDFEYIEKAHIIILKRLDDQKIIGVFHDEIGFIVERHHDNKDHFLVTDYSKGEENIRFIHYIADSHLNELYKKCELDCSYAALECCHITDNSFYLEQKYHEGIFYNLDKPSKKFNRVYIDEKINNVLGESVILVSEEKDENLHVSDTITYGINPETYEVVTPIWSDLQQRFIPLYSCDCEEARKYPYTSLFDIVLEFEVEKYLRILEQRYEKNIGIYEDILQSKINDSFVKKFLIDESK